MKKPTGKVTSYSCMFPWFSQASTVPFLPWLSCACAALYLPPHSLLSLTLHCTLDTTALLHSTTPFLPLPPSTHAWPISDLSGLPNSCFCSIHACLTWDSHHFLPVGIAITKWCSHMTSHVMTLLLRNSNPSPNCHHNLRHTYIWFNVS